mgnify:CR=1 FL=1
MGIVNKALTGKVHEPILGKEAKLTILNRLINERGLATAETVAIGDGANELPMLQAAGLGVAYRGKPGVTNAARARKPCDDSPAAPPFAKAAKSETRQRRAASRTVGAGQTSH